MLSRGEDTRDNMLFIKDKTNFLDGVSGLLHYSTVKPYLFVDLSTFTSSGSNVRKLLRLVVSCDYLTISLSSGLDHFIINEKNPDKIMISCLRNILANCEPVTVRNFTESEAEKYIRINRGKLYELIEVNYHFLRSKTLVEPIHLCYPLLVMLIVQWNIQV